MAQTVNYVDGWQTRIMQSFVNLTKINSTKYPAVTSVRYGYNDTAFGTGAPVTTAYYIMDQFALRVATLSGFQEAQSA